MPSLPSLSPLTPSTLSPQAAHSTLLFEGRRSLEGKQWRYTPQPSREILGLQQKYNISSLVAEILVKRGISIETAEFFLSPKLRDLMPDPSHLKDLDKCVERILKALLKKEKIAIFGDYDVDGATSTALLHRFFADLGHEVLVYIPHRIEEGYGPNTPALQKLQANGYNLVIMVDCGTTAFEPLEAAAQRGQEIIVIDHHLSLPKLPPAFGIINPNRLDEDSPLKHLCAAGLTYMVMVALHRALRKSGSFTLDTLPNLLMYTDLVALGTVCDVMPLTGLNRAFVATGLKVLAHRQNIGLQTLSDIAGVAERPTAYHLGFLLGPRINAGGRVGKAPMGSRLLATKDPLEAQQLARELDIFNQERKAIEQQVLEEAFDQAERLNLVQYPVIMVKGEGWHPGVIGIVAGRLKERYHRPACVVGLEQGIGKGSGRSVHGVNLGQVMQSAVQAGLLLYGGGHTMAAGFTVAESAYDAFYDHLNKSLQEAVDQLEHIADVDGVLTPGGAQVDLVEDLEKLEPFGSGNPTPKFCIHRARVSYVERVGVDHLRCRLIGEDGASLKAMCFRAHGTPKGDLLLRHNNAPLNIMGTLKIDTWNGRKSVTCFIEDMIN